MSDDLPVKVGVWSKLGAGLGWGKVGELRTWTALDVETRHLQPGPWSITLPWDDQSRKLTKLHRLTFDLARDTGSSPWYRLGTGVVEQLSPHADERGKPALDVVGVDALALLGDALCWPDPAAAVGSQTVGRYVATGVAETVLRNLIVANLVTRRGEEITVPASLGRGSTIKVNERFSNLLAVVAGKAELAGLGVRFGLVDTTGTRAQMTLQFHVPVDRSGRVRLSHKVGTLKTWRQNDAAPAGTDAIVGGGGKGVNRLFRRVVDASAETAWGRKREVFVDARDAESDTTVMDERATEALLEAAAQSSFELDAVEAEGMRFGQHFDVGDLVKVELLTGLSAVERLGAVKVAGGDSGLSVSLIPGNPDQAQANPMFSQAAIIRGLRRQLTALQREEL